MPGRSATSAPLKRCGIGPWGDDVVESDGEVVGSAGVEVRVVGTPLSVGEMGISSSEPGTVEEPEVPLRRSGTGDDISGQQAAGRGCQALFTAYNKVGW